MSDFKHLLEAQRSRRASIKLYGYYTNIVDANQQKYQQTNVIATTNASDFYVHTLLNIKNEPDFAGMIFGNRNLNNLTGFLLFKSNNDNFQFWQYDTSGNLIILNSTHNFSGIGTLTATYEASTNDYRMYINGSVIGSRSGSVGVFNSGSATTNLDMLRWSFNSAYSLRNSSLFSVAAGNSVPTPAEVLQMHNDTFTSRVAAKLNDSDHQWNLVTYPEAPSTLPDNTTGAPADFSLVGAQPPNRQFIWKF